MKKDKSKKSGRAGGRRISRHNDLVTREMQSAKGLRKITKGLLAAQELKNRKLKDKIIDEKEGGTNAGNVLRILGHEKSAIWFDRFFGSRDSDATPSKDKKSSTTGEGIVKTVAQNSGQIKIISKKLDSIGELLNIISDDVVDIKKLLLPRGMVAKGKKGTESEGRTQFVQYNPLAPSGEQLRQVTESGKISVKKPGADFKDSATQKAALETARLALKIQKEEEAKSQLRMKYRYSDPKESDPIVGMDPVAGMRVAMSKGFDDINKKIDGMKDEGGIFSDLWTFIKNLSFVKMLKPFLGLLMTFGKMGLLGLALWAGYEIGTWIYDKIAPYLLDAMEWVADKYEIIKTKVIEVKDWIVEKFTSLREWFEGLPERIISAIKDPFGINKRREEKAKKKEAENAEAGRTRGGVASAKGPDMDKSIEHYDKMSKDAKATKEQREAASKARDSLIGAKMRTPEGVPTNIPASQPSGPGPTSRPTTPPKSSSVPAGATGTIRKAKTEGGLLMPDSTIKDIIIAAADRVGVDQGIMMAMAKQESTFNPNAKAGTSTAKGLYQFLDGTWSEMVKKYGNKYPELNKGQYDPTASAVAGALYIKENGAILSKAGVPVDGTSIYAAHFLGPGGARKLFTSDPSADATALMPAPAKANKHIFYNKDGSPRTVAEVQKALFEKVGKYADMYADRLQSEKSGTMLASKQSAPGSATVASTTAPASGPTLASTGTATPAPAISGAAVDGSSREVAAQSTQPVIINAPTNVSSPVMASNSSGPKTPLPKASVTNRDDSFVRTASRDVAHPTMA